MTRWIVRERRFQRRRPEAKPPAFAPKDWLSVGISILALTLSGLGAYYTFIRQVDDVRVSLGGGGVGVSFRYSEGRLEVSSRFHATFINSGNRGAAILSASVLGSHLADLQDKTCDRRGGVIYYALEPFVIKPGEILVKRMTLEGGEEGRLSFPLSAGEPRTHEFMICMEFTVISPDNYWERIIIPLETLSESENRATWVKSLHDERKPIILIR